MTWLFDNNLLDESDLDLAADAAEELLGERCRLYRPDVDDNLVEITDPPWTGAIPDPGGIPCEVEPVSRMAAPGGTAGGAPVTPIRFTIRFKRGRDVDERDRVEVMTLTPPKMYTLISSRSPHSLELLMEIDAEFSA